MKFISLFLSLGLALGIVAGCATSPDQAAKKIQTGMNKSEIIELMGNPDHADRIHGSDRWIYDATRQRSKAMEVYFTDGRVSLFGPPAASKKETQEKGFKPLVEEKPTLEK